MTKSQYAARWGWLLFAALFLLLMVPRWCGVGMFVDGVTYATIARNLAEATPPHFWELHYTATVHPQFYEHPPLAIWLMAGAFAVLGDVSWAESAYAVMMALAFVGTLVALWRAAEPGHLGSWAFCSLVFLCPLTSWVFANNMLEAPLTVFCMLALTCLLRGGRATGGACAAWGACAGICMVAAVLCKGPPALFVVVWPIIAYLVWPARRGAILWSSASAGLVCVTAAMAMVFDSDVQTYLTIYLHRQLWQSLQGARETAPWRGVALVRLLSDLALPCSIIAALAWRSRHIKTDSSVGALESGVVCPTYLAWGVLALAASLPVVISPKQSGWYIYQSLPLYMLALALRFRPVLLNYQQVFLRHARIVLTLAVGLACVACLIGSYRLGRIDKHKDFHRDLAQLEFAPEHVTVQVCPAALLGNWGLHANMARYFHTSLGEDAAAWRLVDSQASACTVPSFCRAANLNASQARYVLYHCDQSS